ncbi:MAG TPA: NAD-dependent succinate-semialdehyde dehydrogenase [Candidatus Eremiobacteraceae bacterium]|nr:NAD-dependent succinate-semialdehyde dehydrogenase [Candidatus Eremiobacteraceae bacterium]
MAGIASINPATGQTIKTFEALNAAELENKIAAAQRGFERNRALDFPTRAQFMNKAAELLTAEKRELAKLATLEMGKTLRQAVAEVEKCAWACRYYADNAAAQLADERVTTDATESLIRYQPLGVILAIMPWNFPYWQVFRFAAPALMAGNAGLLKHASNVPQCALAIESIFERAGFPVGTFGTLLIGSGAVEAVIKDPRVRAVTLTGSELAGRTVAAQAGHEIKKTVLELGGSDPFVVMPSADVTQAVQTAVTARVQNNGQSCIAAKRFITALPVADDFARRMVERFESLKVGDPMDDATDVGPLVNESAVQELDDQVHRLVEAGGTVLTGGKRLEGRGFYYAPTVVAGVPVDAPVAKEELFGPVAVLFRARDADDAIAIANATTFGLGSSVWTNDAAEREKFINGLEAGAVFVNGMVKSDPRLPFGGVKASGYGRELGTYGIREFVNIKSVWIGPPKQ